MEDIIKKFLRDHGIPEERSEVLKTMVSTYTNNLIDAERDRIKKDLENYLWINFSIDIDSEEYSDIIYKTNE